VNVDGNDLHVLQSEDSFLDYNPEGSPDGSKIVFTAGGGDAIDIMNADGSGRHRLVSKTAGEVYGYLSWSPDDSKLLFASQRGFAGTNGITDFDFR